MQPESRYAEEKDVFIPWRVHSSSTDAFILFNGVTQTPTTTSQKPKICYKATYFIGAYSNISFANCKKVLLLCEEFNQLSSENYRLCW